MTALVLKLNLNDKNLSRYGMLKRLFDYGVRKAIDWYFRVRSAQTLLLKSGTTLLLAAIVGTPLFIFLARSVLNLGPDQLHVIVDTLDGPRTWVAIVGAIMIACAIILIFLRWF